MIGRIPIVNIRPQVANGRWPARAVVGEALTIRATIFREGHDLLGAGVVLRPPDGSKRPLVMMRETNHGLAEWEADIEVDLPGRWSFVIEAWDDPVATWRHGIELKHAAGVPVTLELREGEPQGQGGSVRARAELASSASATARMRAPIGISSPDSRSG